MSSTKVKQSEIWYYLDQLTQDTKDRGGGCQIFSEWQHAYRQLLSLPKSEQVQIMNQTIGMIHSKLESLNGDKKKQTSKIAEPANQIWPESYQAKINKS